MSAVDGMVVEVRHHFDASPERVWDLLSDVERMAGLGPEHFSARWGDQARAVGARFEGSNRRDGREWTAPCQVVVCERPSRFGWLVGLPEQPSSYWTYEIRSDGEGTSVTQRFEHGRGFTFLRRAVDKYPDRADELIAARAAELKANMTAALTGAQALL